MHQQEEDQINLKEYPGAEAFVNSNYPAATLQEATQFFSTEEIINMCNDVVYNESLNQELLYKILLQEKFLMVNVGNGIHRWLIK